MSMPCPGASHGPAVEESDNRISIDHRTTGGDQMTRILEGVRILEVAEHTFVPAASAALADLGAEVIKIEHVSRGDAMRGLASTGVATMAADVHGLLEHSNRGKQSLGLDLSQPDGLDVLYKLAATCDVFLTNKLPRVATKLTHRRRRHPRRTTRTSSTCADPARATGGPMPTRARTTRSPTGRGPGSRYGQKRPEDDNVTNAAGTGIRRLDRRDHDRRGDHGCAVPPREDRPCHRRRRVAARPPACGRWAARWRCRCR